MTVKLTKPRANLLTAIRNTTKVHLYQSSVTGDRFVIWLQPDGSEKVVTAIARWLEDQQLIRFGEPEERAYRRQAARITASGRAALDAHNKGGN